MYRKMFSARLKENDYELFINSAREVKNLKLLLCIFILINIINMIT